MSTTAGVGGSGFDLGLPTYSASEVSAQDYGSWLLYGPQGSGKTYLASTLAKLGPTVMIDLVGENGPRAFAGSPWEKNITIVRPESVTQLDDLYWKLAAGGHPYKAVIIDSITSVQRLTGRYLRGFEESTLREIRRGASAKSDWDIWGQSLGIVGDIVTYYCRLAKGNSPHRMHVAITAQYKAVENEVEGIVERLPDVQKGAVSQVLGPPDYVLWTDVERNPAAVGDDTQPASIHTVRFGEHVGYRTKARIPYDLQGRLPSILGRNGQSPDLATLSRVLRIGGVPTAPAKTKTTKTTAQPETAEN